MDAQLRSAASAGPADGAEAPSTSTSSADGDDNAGGANVWVLVLLFALLLLPFLPSAVRRGGGPWGRGGGGGGGINFKSGWAVVNLCLVLFAILCGLLGRGAGGDGERESPSAAGKKERQMSPAPAAGEWETYSSFTAYSGHQHRAHTGGIRRMKSSSSYPELRLGSDGVWALASPDAAWRFHDDAELEYRARRPGRQERTWDVDPQGRRTPVEVKTIPVDTFVERRRRRSVPNMAEVEQERPQTMDTARSRGWSTEATDVIPEQAATVEVVAPVEPPPPPPQSAPAPPGRRRRSLEKLPRPEELEAEVTVDEVRDPTQASRRRRRSRSVENLPRPEEVLQQEIVVEDVRSPLPPPPPPPPPPHPSTASRSKKKRSGSVGGAKELASAIALFYQKKRKSITMKAKRTPHQHHHHSDDHYSPPPSDASASPEATTHTTNHPPPPPPPPPPPSSIFSNLFKKGSKSRRIHSVAPPHLPLPPPPTRRSKKPPTTPSRSAPPAPPPPLVRTRAPRAHAHPQPLPMYPRRVYYTYYLLPPPSPPLPPPPPPPPLVSEGEEDAPSVTASPAPAYCASPDVNAKADKFIESFREGLKLEKLNTYRDKWQRQIQEDAAVTLEEDEDGELMVIGSLFGDDVSLPETPATVAVAVGF